MNEASRFCYLSRFGCSCARSQRAFEVQPYAPPANASPEALAARAAADVVDDVAGSLESSELLLVESITRNLPQVISITGPRRVGNDDRRATGGWSVVRPGAGVTYWLIASGTIFSAASARSQRPKPLRLGLFHNSQ